VINYKGAKAQDTQQVDIVPPRPLFHNKPSRYYAPIKIIQTDDGFSMLNLLNRIEVIALFHMIFNSNDVY